MQQQVEASRGRRTSLIGLFVAICALVAGVWLAAADVNAQAVDPWAPQGPPTGSVDVDAIATDIVRGEVISVESVDTGQAVYRLAQIAITSTDRGALTGTVFAEVPGGTSSSGDEIVVSHQPYLEVGQLVRLLLVEATTQERADLGVDAYSIVGGIEGVKALTAAGQVLSQAEAIGDFTFTGERFASFPQTFNLLSGASTAVESSIFSGVGEWEVVTCSTIDFGFNAYSNDLPSNHNDGVNQIGPSTPASAADTWIGLATWRVALPGNTIVEWDLEFNFRDHSYSPGATVPGSFDYATVTRHEIGHVLGLGHTPAISEVMFASVPPNFVKFINSGDVAGATTLYPAHPFVDVGILTYYEIPATWMFLTGISTGTSATRFTPSQPVTRSQMALFLHRSAGSPAVSGTLPFTDVPSGANYEQAVIWLMQSGITSGTSATTFSPSRTVSRAQMATFLHRYAGSPTPSGTTPFVDVLPGEYYSDPVVWLFNEEITGGTSPTRFSPGASVTRAQMATFMYRFFDEPQTC